MLYESSQIVVIPQLCTYVHCPALLSSSHKFEDATFTGLDVTANAAEMFPMIFHTAVLFPSTGEAEARQSLDPFRLANLFQPVCECQVALSKQKR